MEKILKPELYQVAREGATETAFTGKYYEFDEKELITARSVEISFYFNLKFATPAAGLLFMNLSVKTVSDTEKILLIIWSALKYCVEDAILTWDIFSMMAPTGKRFV
jgi:hypothetical protein